MKSRTLILLGLVLFLGVLALAIQTPTAHAWPWSTKTEVEVYVTRQGTVAPGSVKCNSATLTVNGKTYKGTVSNPFYRRGCYANFYGVPVNTTARITVSGKWYFSNASGSAYFKIPKPPFTEKVKVGTLYIR